MKLIYTDTEHLLRFEAGGVHEMIVENKPLFLRMVTDAYEQSEGAKGKWMLSLRDVPVEFGKYADVTLQIAPFETNRKGLLTKLYTRLEQIALSAEHYTKTGELLCALEQHVSILADDLPFDVRCQRVTVAPLIRALAPEVEERDNGTLEKILDYMELLRELDRDRLFIFVNMRTYFSDEEMVRFSESVSLHDFKVLLLESAERVALPGVERYIIDEDLCEF